MEYFTGLSALEEIIKSGFEKFEVYLIFTKIATFVK